MTDWQATRRAAQQRLRDFVPAAGRAYAARRNFDLGPHDRSNVSALSPYVRHRLVLETEIVEAVLAQHPFSAAEKFIQEVFWRTYFKGWLEQRPQVWTRYRADVAQLLERLDGDAPLERRYGDAVEGRTGIDCFDAWAAELVETGYLHNHARMWFASIWIFTLDLPWQLGADFFLRHLLDGDPASNTLGWRWVAGLHTKGKTYLARASNIARYTNGRFDPEGQLAAAAPALDEADIGGPVALPPSDTLRPDQPFGLLVSEEDGLPEALDLARPPSAIIGLTATTARSPAQVGEAARAFAAGAVADALSRAGERFCVETRREDETEDWAAVVAAWAQEKELSTVATAYAPVGPVAERLQAVERALDGAGIRLVRLRRRFDTVAWPHATKGFFGLKARIPSILSATTGF